MTSNVALQSSVHDQAVLDAADVTAVSQLIVRERLSRDLGLWEQMHDCYHEDSVVRLSWLNGSGPEFVRRSKDMAARNVKATHRLGPDSGDARGQSRHRASLAASSIFPPR